MFRFWLAALAVTCSPAVAQISGDRIYEAGTDAGMLYLSEYSGKLRVFLLVRECGFSNLAGALADFPHIVTYAAQTDAIIELPAEFRVAAAQVARAYVLGYDAGVQTEFMRLPDEWKGVTCEVAAAAAAAGALISQ